jgi:3'-5' exoribonuclease
VILNYLDDLDSKINGVQAHLQKEPENGAAWSSYHRIYDRYFFKETGEQPILATEVHPASQPVAPAAQPLTPPVAKEKPAQRRRQPAAKDRDLRYSLADQLKEKTLNLFAQLDEGDN